MSVGRVTSVVTTNEAGLGLGDIICSTMLLSVYLSDLDANLDVGLGVGLDVGLDVGIDIGLDVGLEVGLEVGLGLLPVLLFLEFEPFAFGSGLFVTLFSRIAPRLAVVVPIDSIKTTVTTAMVIWGERRRWIRNLMMGFVCSIEEMRVF